MTRARSFAAVLLAGATIGCGDSATNTDQTDAGGGRVVLPKSAVDARAADSPERAVLQTWRWLQLGAYPVAVRMYDEDVREALGAATIVGALQSVSTAVSAMSLSIRSAEETEAGTLVEARATSKGNPANTFVFLLRRRDDGWKIVYDSLLSEAVGAHVQARVQREVAPGADAPSPRAAIAGARAAERYRELFAPGPLQPDRDFDETPPAGR